MGAPEPILPCYQDSHPRNKAFTILKYTLMSILVVDVICIILLSLFTVSHVGPFKIHDTEERIFTVTILLIILVVEVVGALGVYKEHLMICIALAILTILGFFGSFEATILYILIQGIVMIISIAYAVLLYRSPARVGQQSIA